MIDEQKLNQVFDNLNVEENDNAYQQAIPNNSDLVLLKVHDEPQVYNGNNWYPVDFKCGNDVYQLSLKGLLQAEGLEYSKRNLRERIKMWYALNDTGASAAARKFHYVEQREREITYRKDIEINGELKKAGTTGTMKYRVFGSKKVG